MKKLNAYFIMAIELYKHIVLIKMCPVIAL